MSVPKDLKYTQEHEWVRLEGGEAVVGITDYAQSELGDVVFVELPEVGATVKPMATFGSIEAVKAVSELFAPVGGQVVAVNQDLAGAPEAVNQDPYGKGWMIRVKVSDTAQAEKLLSAEAYESLIGA